jgi:hypothetical protein
MPKASIARIPDRQPAERAVDLHDRLWSGFVPTRTWPALSPIGVRSVTTRTPRYVRTVQRFGHAFAEQWSRCRIFVGALKGTPNADSRPRGCFVREASIPLPTGRNILGRVRAGPLARRASRGATRGSPSTGRTRFEDRGSKNGTFLRGRSDGREQLADGDAIALGGVALIFRAPALIARRTVEEEQEGPEAL